jgi:hypothetical protein
MRSSAGLAGAADVAEELDAELDGADELAGAAASLSFPPAAIAVVPARRPRATKHVARTFILYLLGKFSFLRK